MRAGLILAVLFVMAPLSGCLGSDEPDYSDFEGCTDDSVDEECEIEIVDENVTANETAVDIGTYENQTLPLIQGLARNMGGEWSNWSTQSLLSLIHI